MVSVRVEVPYELPDGGEVFISADVHLSPHNAHIIEDFRVRDLCGHDVDIEDEDKVFDDLTDDFVWQAMTYYREHSL